MAGRDPLASLRRLGRVQLNMAKTDAAEAARTQRGRADAVATEAARQQDERDLLARANASGLVLPGAATWLRHAGIAMRNATDRFDEADVALQAARDQLAQRWGRLEAIDTLIRERRANAATPGDREAADHLLTMSPSPPRPGRGKG